LVLLAVIMVLLFLKPKEEYTYTEENNI